MTIGQIIKKLRKENFLSQEELAEQLSISPQAISKWETDTSLPDISQVVPISHFFNVSTDVLFGIHGQDSSEEIAAAHERYIKYRKWDCEIIYNELSILLKKYPSSHMLLLDYIHVCDTMLGNKKGDREEIFTEAERCASVLLTYSHEFSVLQKTYSLMAQIYMQMKKFDKAEEYIKILSVSSNETQGALLADLYMFTHEKEKRERQIKENIRDTLNTLLYSIIHLGNNTQNENPDYELSIEIYKKVEETARAIFGSDYEAPVAFQMCQSMRYVFNCYVKLKDVENSLKYFKKFYDYAIEANKHNSYNETTLLFNEYEDLDYLEIDTDKKERLCKRYFNWLKYDFDRKEVEELLGNTLQYKQIKYEFYSIYAI